MATEQSAFYNPIRSRPGLTEGFAHMARIGIPFPPQEEFSNFSPTAPSRRSAAVAVASSVRPHAREVFEDEFFTEPFEEHPDELAELLSRVESFSRSPNAGAEELFKFRELLLEVAHSVFLRWKVLHQLRTMALTDELTGLYNRRGFLLLGVHNVRLALRSEQPLLLFFADVDGLKAANDRFGHVHGDALLVACGEVLKMTFRESDIVARLGGDEFAILAQGGTGESRDAVLRRLDSALVLMNRDVLAPHQLSLSVGAARLDPQNPVSLSELLSIADREVLSKKRHRASSLSRVSSKGDGNGHA